MVVTAAYQCERSQCHWAAHRKKAHIANLIMRIFTLFYILFYLFIFIHYRLYLFYYMYVYCVYRHTIFFVKTGWDPTRQVGRWEGDRVHSTQRARALRRSRAAALVSPVPGLEVGSSKGCSGMKPVGRSPGWERAAASRGHVTC